LEGGRKLRKGMEERREGRGKRERKVKAWKQKNT